ncbi:MAG: class I SAM-dependent methyltransferase, partial [Alphaproteobacteria bacterium]|nr:class I SAM-dependent methyltransferase [Alphaproteobacteria bacterium]
AGLYWTYLKDHCRGRLLDLGCGSVPLFEAYRDLVDENVCVDWANSLHNQEHLDHQCDLTKELPFSDKCFDTIILSSVLEHIPEPMHIWREMVRVLRAGGKIILNVPFYYCLHEQPHHYYRFTEFALKRFAQLTGLEILVLKPTGGAPEILADILAKNLGGKTRLGKYGAVFVQFLCRKFIDTRMGERVSASTAQRFPLGYFMVVQKR